MKTFESNYKRVGQKGPTPESQALKICDGSSRVNKRCSFRVFSHPKVLDLMFWTFYGHVWMCWIVYLAADIVIFWHFLAQNPLLWNGCEFWKKGVRHDSKVGVKLKIIIVDFALLSYCCLTICKKTGFNFITTSFEKFFETGKFEVRSHIVHCIQFCLESFMLLVRMLIFKLCRLM